MTYKTPETAIEDAAEAGAHGDWRAELDLRHALNRAAPIIARAALVEAREALRAELDRQTSVLRGIASEAYIMGAESGLSAAWQVLDALIGDDDA